MIKICLWLKDFKESGEFANIIKSTESVVRIEKNKMIERFMKSSLFKNSGIYTITNIINASIPFFLLPILTRYLTPEEYGIVSMFSLLIALVTPFIGLNVHGAIARRYYDSEPIDIPVYITNCFLILVSSTISIGVLFLVFSKPIGNLFSFPSNMLWLVVTVAFSQFVINIFLTILQVQKKALLYGTFNILKTVVNIALSIIFVITFKLGWEGRLYAWTIAFVLFSIISIFLLIKSKWIKIAFNKKFIFNALMFGIPLIPHAFSGSIISMTDRFFITNMVGLAATGIYTVGYQVGSIINILTSSFNKAYVPWLYERLARNEHTTKVKIVKFTYLYFFLITFLSIGMGFAAPYLMQIFIGKAFNESSFYVIWIAMGYGFNGMYLMVVNYIFYAEKTKFLAMVTFSTAIINIMLSYLFVHTFGAIGAAQATTITFFIKFIWVWSLSAKVQNMPWKDAIYDLVHKK